MSRPSHLVKICLSLFVCVFLQDMIKTVFLKPPDNIELQLGKLTLKKRTLQINSIARKNFYFFSNAPSLSLPVYTRSRGWHTDLSLGWRPAAGAALAARPWETGGRHPNVITAAKLLSIKAKLQKYVPRGRPTMKTEPRLSSCCLRSAVEVALRYVWWDLLWARNSKFHSCWQASGCTCGWLCGNSYWVNLAIMPCYCSSSLMPNECAVHRLYEGGSGWQLATLCRHLS